MRLPSSTTNVTFPAGAVTGSGTVLAVLPQGNEPEKWMVVVDETPFHPLDHTWPDQPADTGELTVAGHTVTVSDCLTGAASDGELLVGEQIPVGRGTAGWRWFVLHVTNPLPGMGADDIVGQPVRLRVDEARRRLLSAGHTACHLAALALNGALAHRWRKQTRADGLGHPDFDALAITSSRIHPGGSTDVYRIGKSLRKAGFQVEGLREELPRHQEQVNQVLAGWVAADSAVRIDIPGPELVARRTWNCVLPEGVATIPCGGTHLANLGEFKTQSVELSLNEEESSLSMHTTAMPR